MNKQIIKLAEQAKGFVDLNQHVGGDNGCMVYTYDGLEKFAELIVAECIEQVKGQYVPVIEDKEMMKDTHWDGYVQCGVDSVVAIREHFYGVEEVRQE
jgi:hypothetical protein